MAARANGKLKPGRHIVYAPSTPMTNLFMTLLDTMDVHPESMQSQYVTEPRPQGASFAKGCQRAMGKAAATIHWGA